MDKFLAFVFQILFFGSCNFNFDGDSPCYSVMAFYGRRFFNGIENIENGMTNCIIKWLRVLNDGHYYLEQWFRVSVVLMLFFGYNKNSIEYCCARYGKRQLSLSKTYL
jgi:hypothetical protein